jgi:hypothetical protein
MISEDTDLQDLHFLAMPLLWIDQGSGELSSTVRPFLILYFFLYVHNTVILSPADITLFKEARLYRKD